MASFGRYETVRELHRSGFTVLYSGRAKADSEENFAIKVFQPSAFLLETEKVQTESDLFLNSAQVQQKTAGGAEHWAPIHECNSIHDGAFYTTNKYDRSLQQLIDVRIKLSAQALCEIVESVAKGLVELKQACGRPHGNLKATNVLIAGEGDLSQTSIVLSDPLPDRHLDTQVHWDTDLRDIAEIIYQLIMHRPTPSVGGWQITDSKEWDKLGKQANDWISLCNRLLNAHMKPGTITIETLIDELAQLKKIKPVLSFRRLIIAIGLIVITGTAAFIIKPDIFPSKSANIKDWKQLFTEYVDWIRKMRTDLGGRTENDIAKRWRDQGLSLIVENIKKASYPYDIEYVKNVLVEDLSKIETQEDIDYFKIKDDKTTDALIAIEIIKYFFDPKTDPNSFRFYNDPNSPVNRKEYQKWPVLVKTQQTANKFKERRWQEPAKSLEDLTEQVRPGLNNTNIAENVDKILKLDIFQFTTKIESRWANIEKNQKIIDSTEDPILTKFIGYIQSKLVSTNLDILGRELEQMDSLAGNLAKFIEDNWQKVDKNTFLNDHENDSEENLTDKTFTDRLVLIKDYVYLDPNPLDELSELENFIDEYMELALASSPVVAQNYPDIFNELQQDVNDIKAKPAIRKYQVAFNDLKLELQKLKEKVIAAAEKPEEFIARIKEQNAVSDEALEEVNEKWRTLRDNLLVNNSLDLNEPNLVVYTQLRSKIEDTNDVLNKLDEELQRKLPSQVSTELKEKDWNNKLKQLYAQERTRAITRIVESIPLQNEVPDINAPSLRRFSRTQFSIFQQLQVDLSGILAAFNEIEDGLNTCYLLGQKLPESDRTVRLLWNKWKDTDILKDTRVNETLARLTKRIKDLEEIEYSDDRDTLGNIAADPNSQTEAMYAAWKRLGDTTDSQWPNTDKEWAKDKEIQEALRAKLLTIKAENRAIELRNTLDDVSLKREKNYREANIRRYKTIVIKKSSADPVIAKFGTLEPYNADADLDEVTDFENRAKALAEFVTDPNWPVKYRTDLFVDENQIYKKTSLTKNDFKTWMDEVKNYKIVKDPREGYQWEDKINEINKLIEDELDRKGKSASKENPVSAITSIITKPIENALRGKQTSPAEQSVEKLKQEYDKLTKTMQEINAMLTLPAIEKNKEKIDTGICKELWETLLTHEATVRSIIKPEYCKHLELLEGKVQRLVFSTTTELSADFEPVNISRLQSMTKKEPLLGAVFKFVQGSAESLLGFTRITGVINKLPLSQQLGEFFNKTVEIAGWEQIRQAVKSNDTEWLSFFHTIDLNKTKNIGWPKYIVSKKDPTVILRFIPAGDDNPEPFYMATHEITNAQYRFFMEETGAINYGRRPSWSWFKDQNSKDLILSQTKDVPPCAIKWDASQKSFTVALEDADTPVTYVTYYGAQSYAKWIGAKLPEVEQ
ncbi:MAG: SUMF1/EgtB/PvdO family nonheme iron enzyme, partial [Sedimentisphaerales bacterium]|nr:SUMF1/EgtB/PvdO family nonheme iron enzyme [Sedimentisphaerales bacterium]